MTNRLTLRALEDADLILLKHWLYLPHVARWYEHPLSWLEEAEGRRTEYQWINHYIALLEHRPIGFCQYYEYCNSGETWHGSVELEGTYSIDYLIGEVDCLRHGLGRTAVRALVEKIRVKPGAKRVIVQPDLENEASCGVLRTCGFQFDQKNELYILPFCP